MPEPPRGESKRDWPFRRPVGATRKPPVQPPPKKEPQLLWDERGLFTAWGLARSQWGPTPLAIRAHASSFDWVALQIDQHNASDAAIVRQYGLKYVAWGVSSQDSQWTSCAADGYIVQVENSIQHDDAVALLQRLPAAAPKAVVTTFGGSDTTELVAALQAHSDGAIVECYIQDDPIHADIPRMLWQASHDGWVRAWPLLGMYRGIGLDSYPTLPIGSPFSVWNAEQMRDQDWNDIANRSKGT